MLWYFTRSYCKYMSNEVINERYKAVKLVKWMPIGDANMDNSVTQQVGRCMWSSHPA